MQYVWGALAGLAWGALAALVNYRISKAAVKKNSNTSMLAANAARMGVDLITLGAVYLLRKRLPFSFEATIIGAAIALSMLSVVFAFHLVKPEKK